MKNDNAILFDRRGFLKSAALLAGAAALDVSSTRPAHASTTGQPQTSLSYWNGHAFVDPSTLASGDTTLLKSGVNVTIEHYGLPDGDSPLFRGFTAVFLIKNGSQTEYSPFYAWAPSNPVKRAKFFMPASPANGILFAIDLNDAEDSSESYYLSTGTAAQTAKLRTGRYVIASGSPSYNGLSPRSEDGQEVVGGAHGVQADFEYVLIDVTKG